MHTRSGVSEVAHPDDGLTRNPLKIGNTFNKYFSSVFTIDDDDNPRILFRASTEMSNIDFTLAVVYSSTTLHYSSGPHILNVIRYYISWKPQTNIDNCDLVQSDGENNQQIPNSTSHTP